MAKRKQKRVNKQSKESNNQTYPRANFIQRMAAYLLDLLAISVVLLIASIFASLVVFVGNKIALINLNAYSSIADYLAHSLLFAAYLGGGIIAFYGYFWSQKGQTLGMKVCRLRIQNSDGSNISFTQCLIRMATSAFGLGNIFALMTNHNAFQDLWAECEVVVVTKELSN